MADLVEVRCCNWNPPGEYRIEIKTVDGTHHMWIGDINSMPLTDELVRAMATGEGVTVGGLAEAGWRYVGEVAKGAVFK